MFVWCDKMIYLSIYSWCHKIFAGTIWIFENFLKMPGLLHTRVQGQIILV